MIYSDYELDTLIEEHTRLSNENRILRAELDRLKKINKELRNAKTNHV